jgi:hypothetical protein
LTPPARFCYISTMKALIQTGSSGRVPVPPEKRFLINLITTEKAKTMQTPDSADGLNDVNLWPNNKPAPDGFRFDPMLTDYDTLSKGDQSSSDRGS